MLNRLIDPGKGLTHEMGHTLAALKAGHRMGVDEGIIHFRPRCDESGMGRTLVLIFPLGLCYFLA
ncbi:MAG: hypothetical protein ABSA41_05425 [Terriglobia bacterium]